MKTQQPSNEKILLQNLVRSALSGKVSIFKECFERFISSKTDKLISEEKTRIANMFFSDVPAREKVGLKESAQDEMYDTLYITDAALFEREKPHMPEWMREALVEGYKIPPVREKDGVELSSKFHSIEFGIGE